MKAFVIKRGNKYVGEHGELTCKAKARRFTDAFEALNTLRKMREAVYTMEVVKIRTESPSVASGGIR